MDDAETVRDERVTEPSEFGREFLTCRGVFACLRTAEAQVLEQRDSTFIQLGDCLFGSAPSAVAGKDH